MMISGGVSVVQLPVLGWFSQTAFVAAALSSLFGATPEAATACAATILLGTFLCVIPAGLIWAQFEHVSLRKVTAESEHAEEELACNEQQRRGEQRKAVPRRPSIESARAEIFRASLRKRK